jgi:hypothetical protein
LPVMRIVLLPVLLGRDTTPRPKPDPAASGKGTPDVNPGTKKDRVVLRP